MAGDKALHESLRFRPWPPGDPWVLVETILHEVEGEDKQRQILNLTLESVAATLEANLKLVNGLRQVVGGQQARG